MLSSFAVSSIIHLMLVVPAVSLLMPAQVHKVQLVPVQLVDVPPLEETKKTDVTPQQPKTTEPKTQKITAPKLLSKPDTFGTSLMPRIGNIKKEIIEPEKPLDEKLPSLASPSSHPGSVGDRNPGSKPEEAEGSAAGVGILFGKGDVEVEAGSGLEVGAGGQGASGLGRGAKGDGAGGGTGASGERFQALPDPWAVIRSNRDIRSPPGKQALKGPRSLNSAFWRTAKWERCRLNDPQATSILITPLWTQ